MREALEELGEVLLPVKIVATLRGVVDIPGGFFELLEGFEELGGLRNGETRHSTISAVVRPFTALTAVERLAVRRSEPTWVAASLPVLRSITCAWADC